MSKLGVITGLKFEADIIHRATAKLDHDHPLYASVAGNQDKSYEKALSFVKEGAVGLVSFGIAGGLTDNVPVGTLILGTEVYCGKGSVYKTDKVWRDNLEGVLNSEISPVHGPVVSLPYALETEDQKRTANKETGALGVDMESFGVAKAAQEMKVPFIVIRAVSDGAADTLPACVVPAMGPEGEIKLGPVLKSIAGKPGDISHLIGFGLKTRKANATLRRVSFLGLPLFGFRG